MDNLSFFDTVIHTDKEEVPNLKDQNAAQFLMKMASLRATVTFWFDSELFVTADTPLGRYSFIFEAPPNGDLVVEQVV
jgi:hypothetical protein